MAEKCEKVLITVKVIDIVIFKVIVKVKIIFKVFVKVFVKVIVTVMTKLWVWTHRTHNAYIPWYGTILFILLLPELVIDVKCFGPCITFHNFF